MDFKRVFSSYGSYHNDPTNKAIHVVCVPLILVSLFHLLQHVTPVWVISGCEVDLPVLLALLTCLAYSSCLRLPGLLAWAYFYLALLSRSQFLAFPDKDLHLYLAAAVHALSWVLQFIGHGVFEGRKPALLDNVFQVFSAPLFVIAEVLFMLGWNHKEYQEI
jgi:uncharacterized membrane protein YGL010W